MGVSYGEVVARMKSYGKLKNNSAIARILGITPQALSNHKRRNEFPAKLVVRFADIYGVFVDWLLTGQGPIQKNSALKSSANYSCPELDNVFVFDALNQDEVVYSERLLKILRTNDEHLTDAIKHTIDTLSQFSERTEEYNERLDEKNRPDKIA